MSNGSNSQINRPPQATPWLDFCKEYAKSHNILIKDALQDKYVKQCYYEARGPPKTRRQKKGISN